MPDAQALSAAKRVEATREVYFHGSTFPEVLDMLRNEGPIFPQWTDGIDTRLSTECELVGEGEFARK